MTTFDLLDRDGDGFLTREEFSGTPHRRMRGWRTRPSPLEEPHGAAEASASTAPSGTVPRPAPCGSCRCCPCGDPRFLGAAEDSQALSRKMEQLSSRLDRVFGLLEGPKENMAPLLIKAQEPLALSQQPQEEGIARAEEKPRFLRGGRLSMMNSGHMAQTSTIAQTDSETEAAQLLESREKRLSAVSLVLISANAVYLGIEAELELRSAKADREAPAWMRIVNMLFAVAFFMELATKAWLVRGSLWYRKEERWWNVFDAILVLTAILDTLFAFFNVAYLRVLRILRAVKAARIIRVIGKVQSLRLMVASLVTSFSTLCWACALLGLVIYMCTLMIMPGVQSKASSTSEEAVMLAGDGEPALDRGSGEITQGEYFSSLGSTALTLFMSITGGVDWKEVLFEMRKVHSIYAPFFVLFVAISTFSLTGVLTAVIIEASKGILWVDKDLVIQKTLREQEEKRGYLKELFRSIQRDGVISQRKLNKALDNEENKALFKSLELDVWHTKNLFGFLDEDKSETVTEDEFVEGLMRHRGVITTVLDVTGRLGVQIDGLMRELAGTTQIGSGPSSRWRRCTNTGSSLSGDLVGSYGLPTTNSRL